VENRTPNNASSLILTKHYFTIGEVGTLCGIKPHVLRYWEQEFVQLKAVKRRKNRRYYQQHEVLLVHRICKLLYVEGFTINGARNYLEQNIIQSRVVPVVITPVATPAPASMISRVRSEINDVLSLLQS